MPDDHELTAVNQHYLDKVMNLAEEKDIKATEDIFDARGMKLVAKGAVISRALQERLLVRRLSKPFESSISVADAVDVATIAAEATRIAETLEPVKSMLAVHQGGPSPVQVLSEIRFGGAIGTMLTVIQQAGPAALQHAVLVSLVSICLAQKCRMSRNELSVVALAGLLHDIGELYIDPEYLHSTRRLAPHEWRHVVVHPRIGQRLIEGLEDYPPAVAQAVFEHHERLDGGGYPRQASGAAISRAGQVVSVAEMISGVFLSQDLPLKRAELALKIIPGEHAHELVSAVSEAMQRARAEAGLDGATAVHRDEDAGLVHSLHGRIGEVLGVVAALGTEVNAKSAKLKKLIDDVNQRATVIQRAFSSTGLDVGLEQGLQFFSSRSGELVFETAVAMREIEWRLRGVARDLALQATVLDPAEAQVLQPLVALLDGTA